MADFCKKTCNLCTDTTELAVQQPSGVHLQHSDHSYDVQGAVPVATLSAPVELTSSVKNNMAAIGGVLGCLGVMVVALATLLSTRGQSQQTEAMALRARQSQQYEPVVSAV